MEPEKSNPRGRSKNLLIWAALLLAAAPAATDAADVFASFPMDTSPGWSTQGQWAFGQPLGLAGDPSAGYTGTNVYGYNLGGAYGSFTPPHWLTTTAIDCSERVNVVLKFQRWLGVEASSYIMAAIEVSNDGSNWNAVWYYSGERLVDTEWQAMAYDISATADRQPTVYVRWGMGTRHGSTPPECGWNIDDVVFEGDPTDALVMTPSQGWQASAFEGSQPDPAQAVYTITNLSASTPFDWVASAGEAWLAVSPTNGTLAGGASTNIAVSIDTSGLLPGYHAGSFEVENLLSGKLENRAVGIEILVVPGEIAIDPAGGFVVTNLIGQQQWRTLAVSNAAVEYGTLGFSLAMEQTGYAPPAPPAPEAMRAAMAEASDDDLAEEFAFAAPRIDVGDGYDQVSMPGLEKYLRTGAPVVPVRPVTVAIPPGRTVRNIRFEVLESEEVPGSYRLPPAQGLVSPGEPGDAGETPPDDAIYGRSADWPGVPGQSAGIHRKRSGQVAAAMLFPLQYNPVTGKIVLAKRMRLAVELEDAAFAPAMQVLDEPPAPALPPGGPYKHVIITSAAFEAAPGPWNFQALRDKRTAEGLPSAIVTTEWIYDNYDGTRPDGGSDNPTKIRDFLIAAYEAWGLEYVLLGGAADVVPPRMFWVESLREDYPQYSEILMPVDMYYGCLAPAECTFDGNANGVYGEPDDGVDGGDVDLLAEVCVGRAAVESTEELSHFVRKTLHYAESRDPVLEKVSMVGERLNFGGLAEYAKNMLEQVRLGGEYDGYATKGFGNHGRDDIPDFDTSENLYDMDGAWVQSDVVDLVNGGVHVVNQLGHSNESRIMRLFTYDLPLLVNSNFFFFYSQSCDIGAFDEVNCIIEELTAMEHGAFAAVVNTRYGWGVRNSTDCPSNRFNRQFWNAVFEEDMMEIGRALQGSKEANLWDIGGPGIRWTYYEMMLFGDPAQRFRFLRPAHWLSADPLSADAMQPGAAVNVQIRFDAVEIAAGSYTGQIAVASNDPSNPEQVVPVLMVVLGDDLSVSPEWGVEVSGNQGALALPHTASYSLANSGPDPMDWTVSTAPFWLDADPPAGTLGAYGATNLAVAVNGLANILPPGTYLGDVVFSNASSGATYTRTVHLDVGPPGRVEFALFPLDTDPGWTAEGGWAFGQPLGLEGDPASGHTGTNVYGYNLAGAYENDMPRYSLTTAALDCSGYDNVALGFHRWLGIEASGYDQAAIEASRDGTNWVAVWTHDGDALADAAWEPVGYDIAAIADRQPTVYIRWSIGPTDGMGTACGWNIDDVVLSGEPLPPDADGDGIPDWWEYHYFGTNVPAFAHGDDDPYNNLEEYIAGTDPTDGGSYFMVSGRGEDTEGVGAFILEWPSLEGRAYDLFHATNLFHGFELLEAGLAHPQNSYTASPPAAPEGFYKVDVRMQ